MAAQSRLLGGVFRAWMGLVVAECDMPSVSALVCTRDRGRFVVDTVLSILANTHPNFELVVVDQSGDSETADALSPHFSDPRLKYVKSSAAGKGAALRIGLSEARGAVVAITDDDCIVPQYWLEKFEEIFAAHPNVAVAFCNVEAAEHDPTQGFVPDFVRSSERLLTTAHDARFVRGLGAGIAVRRSMIEKIGGFDPLLGPGSRFPDCDDRDIAMRALLARYNVYETTSIVVKHFGFRTWQQGVQLTRRNFLGIGAAYSKFLKSGRVELMYIPAYEFFRSALWPPIRDLLYLRQPRGIVRITAFIEGFIVGCRTPIDRATMMFVDELPSVQPTELNRDQTHLSGG
jgi:glycosyltransferase involved in cell wall biosynthesis